MSYWNRYVAVYIQMMTGLDGDWEAMGEEERLSYVSLTKRMDDRAV